MLKQKDMKIDLPVKIKREISGTVKDYGYRSERDSIRDALQSRLLELKKAKFLAKTAEIRRKIKERGLTEEEILKDFESFYHRQ